MLEEQRGIHSPCVVSCAAVHSDEHRRNKKTGSEFFVDAERGRKEKIRFV